MTGRVYLRAIVPIGAFFSLSLICSNISYIYLSVSFIQMLKVRILHEIPQDGEADTYTSFRQLPPLLYLSQLGSWV